ncbi:hypothetical protein QWY28_05930 [Nocardioides sp. SOB77]|uniref:YkuD domain-containing protein n=1 Tax=Nocardioides oceani TaxID=3058369 RepID=A0ABT8FCQ7_9ACTN|nr:L,D-transpeptidase family protein [Nocardioides oceani]MDN4172474.1 hypothetical protein [Nocardioides oceani]
MRALLATLALLGASLLPATPAPAAPDASAARVEAAPGTVRLDGVPVRLREGTTQVVTVNRTRGFRARVTFWALTRRGWVERMQALDGRVGYGGLVAGPRRRQGSGTTPLGTYRLPWAFGTHRRSEDWDLRYRRIRRGDHWVQDNASAYYNRYRNQAQGGFRWRLPSGHPDASERLTDYRQPYEFSVVVGFNRRQVRHRGSGIFLHVNGRGATAGCVSAPRWFLVRAMRKLDPAARPVIAIGR